MADAPDPPVEWVRGSWIGLTYYVATWVAIVAVGVVAYETAQTSFSPNAHFYWLFQLVEYLLVFSGIPIVAYYPFNIRIGISPKELVVRGLLRTTRYPWNPLWRYSRTESRTEPPGVAFSPRILVTRRQGDRISQFWASVRGPI
jgi:hypothetical protein